MAKKHKHTPTPKQMAAAKALVENGRNPKPKPIGTVLKSVGYSDAMAKHPKRVTRAKGFRGLLDLYLPEKEITARHHELLNASHLADYIFPRSEDDAVIQEIVESVPGCRLVKVRANDVSKRAYYWSPDNKSRKEAIDMAYKLRGNYKPIKTEETGTLRVSFKRSKHGHRDKLGAAT